MKIRTNAGEVELTAEMVCRGMVFQAETADHPWTFMEPDDAVMREALAAGVARGGCALLGCDPTVASRADCERFGVHGDAAAHGFARLRDGSALDLRREIPTSAVCSDAEGRRFTAYGRGLQAREGDRFIGLDTRHASPGDVRRLCCGADGGAKEGTTGRRVICTLAIGDHDTHEDLATGVNWKDPYDPSMSGCPDCLTDRRGSHEVHCDRGRCGAEDPEIHTDDEDFASCGKPHGHAGHHEDLATGVKWAAKPTGSAYLQEIPESTKHSPPTVRATWTGIAGLSQQPPDRFVFHDGDPVREVVSIQANAYHCECGAETPSDHAGTCKAPFWIREASLAVWCEWRRTGDVSAAEKACHEAQIGAGVVSLLAWVCRLWAAPPEGERAAQERALVALVAAVPEGLDPIGWRAAVLAVHECQSRYGSAIQGDHFAAWLTHSLREHMDDCDAGTSYAYGYHGYLRAIAPAPKVDRVRATWKTRAPVLPCDNGEDE